MATLGDVGARYNQLAVVIVNRFNTDLAPATLVIKVYHPVPGPGSETAFEQGFAQGFQFELGLLVVVLALGQLGQQGLGIVRQGCVHRVGERVINRC